MTPRLTIDPRRLTALQEQLAMLHGRLRALKDRAQAAQEQQRDVRVAAVDAAAKTSNLQWSMQTPLAEIQAVNARTIAAGRHPLVDPKALAQAIESERYARDIAPRISAIESDLNHFSRLTAACEAYSNA